MTITGSGVGGNIGGPLQPSPRELEATAATMTSRAALGIMPDSLEVPFSQLGGNVWKYQSDSSKPTLSSLATLVRASTAEDKKTDDSWKPVFNTLVDRLPPELKTRLAAEMNKPFESRNPNFAHLENILTFTAKGLAWLEEAEKPVEPETIKWDRMMHNRGMPGKVVRGMVRQGQQILGGADAFLNRMGPNLPAHDTMRHFTGQAAEIQTRLEALLKQMQEGKQPPQEELIRLSNEAETLQANYQRIYRGSDLQNPRPLCFRPWLQSHPRSH